MLAGGRGAKLGEQRLVGIRLVAARVHVLLGFEDEAGGSSGGTRFFPALRFDHRLLSRTRISTIA